MSFAPDLRDGEHSFSIDGVGVVDRVFVGPDDAKFILAQWKLLAATFGVTAGTDAARLVNALRKVAVPSNAEVARQVIELEKELSRLNAAIGEQEDEMEAIIGKLYGLTDAERALVYRSKRRSEIR